MLVHGQKWREEPDDPESPMVDAVPVGVSEAFNFEVPRLNCAVGEDCRGDYLYSGSSVDDIATGAWGILRVNGGRVPGLKPLPDNVPVARRLGARPLGDGAGAAAPATVAGQPVHGGRAGAQSTPSSRCRPGSSTTRPATTTRTGWCTRSPRTRPPSGPAPGSPEPLVLRADEGDCVEVTLTNKLTTALLAHGGPADGDALGPRRADAHAARWACASRCTRRCSSTTSAAPTAPRSASTSDPTVAPGALAHLPLVRRRRHAGRARRAST